MEALSQMNKKSLKPKHITWCSLSVVVTGLLQIFGVVRVGKEVHTVEGESCKQRALRMGEAMCKLSGAVFAASFKEHLLSQGNPVQSDHNACCDSFN